MRIIEMKDREFREWSRAYTTIVDAAKVLIQEHCPKDRKLSRAMAVLDKNHVSAHVFVGPRT